MSLPYTLNQLEALARSHRLRVIHGQITIDGVVITDAALVRLARQALVRAYGLAH